TRADRRCSATLRPNPALPCPANPPRPPASSSRPRASRCAARMIESPLTQCKSIGSSYYSLTLLRTASTTEDGVRRTIDDEEGRQMPTLSHWINGQTVTASTDTRLGDITNPATGVVSGQVALGSKATVESAITAAAEAFPAWRDTSLTKRTTVLFAFRELLNARKQELAEIITAEHGKVVSDALGEVARGQEV